MRRRPDRPSAPTPGFAGAPRPTQIASPGPSVRGSTINNQPSTIRGEAQPSSRQTLTHRDPTDPRHLWSWHNHQPGVPDWIPSAEQLRSLRRPLTAPEACRVADTSPKDIQRAVRNGMLKTATSQRTEFLVDDIDAWMNTRPRRRRVSETPQSESPSTAG
jgi:hypothetical protein